ncbi:YjjG family noncanonical pyrimidine nucleotidase [Lactiplantibacillus mudanjiangensis]|uniref:Haloacid dehalogenase [Lactobacillus koreensis] n=1 Tax=Lactiplantibacillus mudanjiangensis TaxID=1296538 RepID=A0A660DZL9_9LACO|nr:YjjG family noncanonical pyrimidine nucleotidase [Lactiplantibacillus mudanjiangensis]VDG22471.1 haloacid dehalogenase [Lactobacillus koreensis] [Lactiplantibacillus mudanjiangensis]VDG26996.1 haloacid dehalogenase [Lactobacillus koreensis] [Lactiplantibacillus mudanjiangensis]
MKKYAIFDLDNTLLDFTRGETEGVTHLLHKYGVTDLQRGLQVYHQVNQRAWQAIEQGAERDPLLNRRFEQTFQRMGLTVTDPIVEQQYRRHLDHNYYTLAGAHALLAHLKKAQVTLIAGTNGIKATQLSRLAGSGLDVYFDQLYISEDVGFAKPDARFFQPIFKQNPSLDSTNTLMIGDGLRSDILGAQQVELPSVWFNPAHLTNETAVKPTYEVDHLATIETLVLA